jgi:hypothetical protein
VRDLQPTSTVSSPPTQDAPRGTQDRRDLVRGDARAGRSRREGPANFGAWSTLVDTVSASTFATPTPTTSPGPG